MLFKNHTHARVIYYALTKHVNEDDIVRPKWQSELSEGKPGKLFLSSVITQSWIMR